MKFAKMAAVLLAPLLLSGCTAEDVRKLMVILCGYEPALDAAGELVKAVSPAPGTGAAADVIEKAAKAGCAAVNAVKAKKGFSDPSKIIASVRSSNGKPVRIMLNGKFVQ